MLLVTGTVMFYWIKSNRILNVYLTLACFGSSLFFFTHGIYHIFNYKEGLNIISYYNSVLFILPCIYLYFQKMINNFKFFGKFDFIHFIIPLAILLFIPQNNYFDFNKNIMQFIFLFIFSIFYLLSSYNEIKKFNIMLIRINEIKLSKISRNWIFFFLMQHF